jgi:hypothetical protein
MAYLDFTGLQPDEIDRHIRPVHDAHGEVWVWGPSTWSISIPITGPKRNIRMNLVRGVAVWGQCPEGKKLLDINEQVIYAHTHMVVITTQHHNERRYAWIIFWMP